MLSVAIASLTHYVYYTLMRKNFLPLKENELSHQKRGIKNPNWAGDSVGYNPLHVWIRKRIEKPKKCPSCNKTKPCDLANISQTYQRVISDWEWLCRKCHMKKDGRLIKLSLASKIYTEKVTRKNLNKKCLFCKTRLIRKRFKKGNRLETFGSYEKRNFCNLQCVAKQRFPNPNPKRTKRYER